MTRGASGTSLVEIAVEQDDAAMEAYLDGTEPDAETLKACIRARAPSPATSCRC